ncbi:DUF3405 domain-containing protein [Aspergillus ibericus CBS 121593]|uniref:Uncharacterized protein n=1 Tax=Aspergillus ibericus CBS 121593 TaxID=1448316 RepID=A0A395GSA6_9EURO|nr:hypothetical protein BO80DRAFT_479643 [Aspergillus ibericus CBS 121593]RAK98460.1 hypothetical protein BO80DRAFT_479643 [Aspergillus ibericus CBS 121593]
MLLIITLARRSDKPHRKRMVKTSQERYEEEQAHLFTSFASTVNRIVVPRSHQSPSISVDSRVRDTSSQIPLVYRPYPDYNSRRWKETHSVPFIPCQGPRGKLLNESSDDEVGVYVGVPEGFPAPMFGSHEAIGFDGALSFDRYSRYGAYGFGENETSVANWIRPTKVDWDQVNWGQLQNQCLQRNADRFLAGESGSSHDHGVETRTAVLIRTFTDREYTENDIQVIRSMVTELSLQSGREYQVILFLHVKDPSVAIHEPDVYRQVVETSVPQEFWDMTVLWKEPAVAVRYPNLDRSITDVHHSQWLSVQAFALEHPEFHFIWNWELDTRFTGHHYEFVDRIADFARKQPRRGLWERNARFYIPGVHGEYGTSFRAYVQTQENEAVWGPSPIDIQNPPFEPVGSSPPVQEPHEDNYEWGVGEDADLITFLPIFHPLGTKWVIRNEVWGYPASTTVPRRAALVTHYRLSRSLLLAMHAENLAGRHLGSELFPATTAFLHGLKAVSVPHPIYDDKDVPAMRVDRWFNSGVNGRSGSTVDSPFSWGRETRFRDVSWYYRANLPGRLYWNFLGWEKDGTGGASYEAQHGRVCLPSILFHPVKDVHPDSDSTGYIFDAELGVEAVD